MRIYQKQATEVAEPAWVCGHWNGSPIAIGTGRQSVVGERETRHYHPYREYYVMIAGMAELEVEGALVALRAGMVVMVEPGEWHQIVAIPEVGAEWVIIQERSEPDTKFVT